VEGEGEGAQGLGWKMGGGGATSSALAAGGVAATATASKAAARYQFHGTMVTIWQ